MAVAIHGAATATTPYRNFMSYILQIETATTVCSVALTSAGKIIGCNELDERNIHAEVINLYIDELIKTADITYADLSAVAVSCGPGSYTGLRIGVSTAKGLCFALGIPLIAVETLASMAAGVNVSTLSTDTLLCPMIDARRMEVYTALFDIDGKQIEPVAAVIIDENSFAAYLKTHKILFIGDGAEKCMAVLGGNANASILPAFVNSATNMTSVALQKFNDRQFEDVAYFEPFYLKDFIPGVKKA